MFQRGEQEGSEAASFWSGRAQCIVFEHVAEEGLRQVFGVLRRFALAAQKNVERIPISAAEFLKGPLGFSGAVALARAADGGPAGRAKIAVTTWKPELAISRHSAVSLTDEKQMSRIALIGPRLLGEPRSDRP